MPRPPRLHHRSVARRQRARHHPNSGVGRAVLSAGADCTADRGRSWLVEGVRHGGPFARAVRRRGGVALCRQRDRSLWRPCRYAIRFAARGGRACRACRRAERRGLFRSMERARRRDGGITVRSGFRDARADFRCGGAGADHHADACRRLCLDGQLAGNAVSHRQGRLARRLSGLCCTARIDRGSAARLRVATPARRGTRRQPRSRRNCQMRPRRHRSSRRTALFSCSSPQRLHPTPSCRLRWRRICWRFLAVSGSLRTLSLPSACCSGPRRCWRAFAN